MKFSTIVFKNLFRRPARTFLTIAGIAVAIGAVVALTSIAWGFEKSWDRTYSARGTDLVLTKVTSQSPLPSSFMESVRDQIPPSPLIASTAGILSDLMSIEAAPAVMVFGWELNSFLWNHLELIDGRLPKNANSREAVLGELAAETMNKKPGEILQIDLEDFTVCGVARSSSLIENGAVILSLKEMQALLEEDGKINFLNIKLTPSAGEDEVSELKRAIQEALPEFKALSGSEIARNNTAIQMAKAMSWATSAIALIVGAFGVMNTIFMSVFERLHEIGILLAIGWKRARILSMILLESIYISLLGGALGVVLGIGMVKILQNTPWVKGKIEGEISLALVLMALGIALVLGTLGGLFPAYRGSKFQPIEALRRD